MSNKKSKEDINKILKNCFTLKNEKILEEGYMALKNYINSREHEEEKYLDIIKSKLDEEPYKSYKSKGDIKIYAFLFNIYKEMEIDYKNNIFFKLILWIFESSPKKEENKLCEIMNKIFSIIQVERYFFLKNFEKLFEYIMIPLLKMKKELRNKAYYLDQLMKVGIANIFQTEYNDDNKNSLDDEFDSIYKYLFKLIKESNENKAVANTLIISWFNFLENLPEKNLNSHYKEIIEILLRELNSKNEGESELSELYLKKIINNIISSYDEFYGCEPDFINNIVDLIINNCINAKENHNKSVSFGILNKFLHKFDAILDEYRQKINAKEKDEILIKKIPFKLFPKILGVIIDKIINFYTNQKNNEENEDDNTYSNPVISANIIFSKLMKKVEKGYITINFNEVIGDFLIKLKDEKNTNLVFDWICQLYESDLFEDSEGLKNLICNEQFEELKEFHVKRIIGVINMLNKHNNNQDYKMDIINKIIKKLSDINFLNNFGIFIINELSDTIEITEIFKLISNYEFSDYFSMKKIIQLLSEYLTTEEKAEKVISLLQSDKDFFQSIYNLFCYNPFDTLVLLLLSKSFELSYFFVLTISNNDSDDLNFDDLSKAVEVFESSIFTEIRIQLLNPRSNIYLVKTLYAISLLLPPGKYLDSLCCRLKCLEVLYDFDEKENMIKNNTNEENKKYIHIKRISKREKWKEKDINKKILEYVDEKDQKVFKQKNLKQYIKKFLEIQKTINNFEL